MHVTVDRRVPELRRHGNHRPVAVIATVVIITVIIVIVNIIITRIVIRLPFIFLFLLLGLGEHYVGIDRAPILILTQVTAPAKAIAHFEHQIVSVLP